MGNVMFYEREPNMAPSCCIDCPYGKHHEICYPCYKDLLGQEGIKAWEKKHPLRVKEKLIPQEQEANGK